MASDIADNSTTVVSGFDRGQIVRIGRIENSNLQARHDLGFSGAIAAKYIRNLEIQDRYIGSCYIVILNTLQ